jgi:hypothetical protein
MLPGQSGFMNIGYGNDWEKFTPIQSERTLFAAMIADDKVEDEYIYMGQYECTRVQSLGGSYWLQVPELVGFTSDALHGTG